nr:hypothetical protein [Tanacetum cinerariifolium]
MAQSIGSSLCLTGKRTISAPRSPNPETNKGESSAPRNFTVIRLCIPQRRSTRLTSPTPIPTNAEADDIILQDTIQLSLVEQKSRGELESKQNVQKVKEHLIAKEIEKLTRFMLRKKFNVLAQHLQEIMEESLPTMVDDRVKELAKTQVPVDSSVNNYMSGHILHVHPTQATPASTQEQQYQLYLTMRDNPQLQQDDLPIWLALKYEFERLYVSDTPCRPYAVRPRDQEDPHDDCHPEGENNAKRHKTSKHGTFVFGDSLSGQDFESELGPSTLGNQEQLDDFDFWTDSYDTDDDEIPTEKVSQELVDEMSHTFDEAKLRKVVDEMLRQRCTSNEHQYHIDQMQNCLKNYINPHAKIFYIKKQKEPGNPKEVVYSNSKIVQIIKTYWELEHEHMFITEIVSRRSNGSIVLIIESDYKNLNKNNIKDMYPLIVNNKVDNYVEIGLLWSLSVFIKSIVIWEKVHDFQLEEEEAAKDDYELTRREKRKHVEESRSTPSPTTIRSPKTHSTLISLDTEKLQELTITDPPPLSSTPSLFSPKSKISATNRLLSLFKPKQRRTRFMLRKKFNVLAQHLQEIMEESLPTMVDDRVKELAKTQVSVDSSVNNYMSGHILHVHLTQATPASTQEQQYQLYLTMRDNPQLQQDDLPIWLALKYEFERLCVSDTPCRPYAVRPRDQEDPHDDCHPEGENSAKRHKTSKHGTFMFGDSLSGQDFESELGPSTSGNQEQLDDFDFWTDSYDTDDDEIPTEKVSQELVDEMSHTFDEAKLRKFVDEMLRQ